MFWIEYNGAETSEEDKQPELTEEPLSGTSPLLPALPERLVVDAGERSESVVEPFVVMSQNAEVIASDADFPGTVAERALLIRGDGVCVFSNVMVKGL